MEGGPRRSWGERPRITRLGRAQPTTLWRAILSKTRTSTYGVCDTRRNEDPSSCQVFYNIYKKKSG